MGHLAAQLGWLECTPSGTDAFRFASLRRRSWAREEVETSECSAADVTSTSHVADFETDVALESSVSLSAAMNKKKRRHRKKKQKQSAVCGEPDALFSDSEEPACVCGYRQGLAQVIAWVRRAGGRRQGDGVRARGREQLGLARYQRGHVQAGSTPLRQTMARTQQLAPGW